MTITAREFTLLREAYAAARQSPDPSTQNGAVLVPRHQNGLTISAFNTFPYRVKKRPERPEKYAFIEHAERNAIFAAARLGVSTSGATLVCPWFACADCGRAIIQAGITRVVGHKQMFDNTPPHWTDSIKDAFTMFEEAGVETELYDGRLGINPLRMNEELWYP